MEYLFNSQGQHIANFVNGQLHAPSGKNIGHFIESEQIFIDMSGNYLGEIIQSNRLMYNQSSSYKGIKYGVYGNYGNAGDFGSPGRYGSITLVHGYEDVKTPWL